MGLVCIQNSSLLVYSKSQKVSTSYCLLFQHSRGKKQPVGDSPPGLFRVKYSCFGRGWFHVFSRLSQTKWLIQIFVDYNRFNKGELHEVLNIQQ